MIRTTHATIKMLRAGREETITLPAIPPRAPATAHTSPVRVDQEVTLQANATDDRKTERLAVVITSVTVNADETVTATCRHGIAIETPRFLRATPGAMRLRKNRDGTVRTDGDGDYTTVQARAIPDEPEPVDDAYQRRIERDTRTAEEHRLHHETRQQRDAMAAAIDELQQRTDIGRAAARRLTRMRRDLKLLDADLRRAAGGEGRHGLDELVGARTRPRLRGR